LPKQILAEIEKVTGPAPDRAPIHGLRMANAGIEEFRRMALERIAHLLAHVPASNDDRIVPMLMSWDETVLPRRREPIPNA
jgi:hypothetical protein